MDLTEAEGLADLVAAETRQQAVQARRQMDGALGRLYGSWHQSLLETLSRIEAEIDFAAEEEVPDGLMATVRPTLVRLMVEIDAHLDDNRRGERLRQGLRIALVGPPNAGKSSLVNMLAKRDMAIVTAIPGTTRDVLEVPLDLGGFPVTIADMAGLRHSDDPIEALGVRRAEEEAENADIRLALFDGATWPAVDPRLSAMLDDRTVVVCNKADLLDRSREESLSIAGRGALPLSCKTGEGVDRLIERLTILARQAMSPGDAPLATRARHRNALVDVRDALARIDRAGDGIELALMAEDLRVAMRAIGRITGMVGVEDILDGIFSEFCIGK
jgi:tRNA modification GTPase